MSTNKIDATDIKRTLRNVQPSHFIFKIEFFSLLLETKTENYESDVFEAGGYNWKLSFYPNGNSKRNGKDHISLYLVISNTHNPSCGWEVNVNFKLFVFDHIHDKYLTIEDSEPVRRFHCLKTEWGFDKFLSLKDFLNPSNGYLVDDTCVFGAEVFVMKCPVKGDCLSMEKFSTNKVYTWKVEKFSALSEECVCSKEFKIGVRNWKVLLYPRGNGEGKGKWLSLFLKVADSEKLTPKLYAKYKLRIRDQVNDKHYEWEASVWFCAMNRSFGYGFFMSLSNLNDKSKGFIMNDTVIIEAEISMLSVVKNFT
ncbi:uncharacterized protein LOC132300102 isoform X2 [Cornus florida]|nr:uncharacterized protein LOC132300102 isoform X2 [Cornus florida]